jgi:hypothetical protein
MMISSLFRWIEVLRRIRVRSTSLTNRTGTHHRNNDQSNYGKGRNVSYEWESIFHVVVVYVFLINKLTITLALLFSNLIKRHY